MPGRNPPAEKSTASEGRPLLYGNQVGKEAPAGLAMSEHCSTPAEEPQKPRGIVLTSIWRPYQIVAACSILGLVARSACLRFSSTPPRTFYSQHGADLWVMHLFPKHTNGYFVDIGAYDGERMSNSKLLEEHGWEGLCADPFPHSFENRKCKLVVGPVAQVSGVHETMADCSEGLTGFLRHANGEDMLSGMKKFTKVWEKKVASCPERNMSTVGIADLLSSGNAPPVIDYVSLDTEGAELHILESWPFDRHCVRTWTVEHNCEQPKQAQIRKLLESQGCRVEQVEVDWWAMCPCGHLENGQSLAADTVAAASNIAAFDQAFQAKTFFPPSSNRTWSGRISVCDNDSAARSAAKHAAENLLKNMAAEVTRRQRHTGTPQMQMGTGPP